MATKFISAITDEAMQKICYVGGGWTLQPYQYIVSETDILDGTVIFDDDGKVTEEAYEKLLSFTTSDMQDDVSKGSDVAWHQEAFSSITKANETTLTHHIVIPPNVDVPSNKTIKTIYFLYKSQDEEIFLYAIAYAVEDVIYEKGITQSLFFNFTVTNTKYVDDINFTLNYSYPNEIADHNTSENVHDNLVRRDGSKTITGTLMYSGERSFTSPYQLVSKEYIDSLIEKLKADNGLR